MRWWEDMDRFVSTSGDLRLKKGLGRPGAPDQASGEKPLVYVGTDRGDGYGAGAELSRPEMKALMRTALVAALAVGMVFILVFFLFLLFAVKVWLV